MTSYAVCHQSPLAWSWRLPRAFWPLALLAVLAAPAFAQTREPPDEKFKADLRELIQLMDAERMTSQMVEYLVEEWKDQYADLSDEFWDQFGEEFKPEEFVELAVPVYAKYLSRSDVAALLEFYRSPVGRTFVLTQPALQQDLVTAGEGWSKEVATRFIEKLKQNPK
jgi:hypothetical protein